MFRAMVGTAHSRAVTYNRSLTTPEAAGHFPLRSIKSCRCPMAAHVLGARDTDGALDAHCSQGPGA